MDVGIAVAVKVGVTVGVGNVSVGIDEGVEERGEPEEGLEVISMITNVEIIKIMAIISEINAIVLRCLRICIYNSIFELVVFIDNACITFAYFGFEFNGAVYYNLVFNSVNSGFSVRVSAFSNVDY
jgi:hypothetical protein